MDSQFIRARKSQLNFYRDVSLYTKSGCRFVLYKPVGMTLNQMRLQQQRHPPALYIKQQDKLKGIQEAQKGFNRLLVDHVKSGDPIEVKNTLVTVLEETLSEPRSGSLEGMADTVDVLISDYAREADVISKLIDMSQSDYSTVLHSINVMAFTLGFAFYAGYSESDARTLGLCALLHDVGKTRIDSDILNAPRRLTDKEFEKVKSHSRIGYNILKKCNFENSAISLSALEHHEKLDGSGYPIGKTRISEAAQIVGLVDCYEALTNDDRPYRKAMGAFKTLQEVIGRDVCDGKFDKAIFSLFVKSLGMVF